jgi:hypothetical protein
MPEIKPAGANPLMKFYRQPKIYLALPSKGHWYPEGSLDMPDNGELPVFAMTAKDELTLKTPDALLNGAATVELIQSCIPNIKNAWQMPVLDLDACLVAIRIATYGESMDVTATPPNTKEPADYTIDLRNILDRYANSNFSDELEWNELKIKIKPLDYKTFSKMSISTFEEQRIFSIVNSSEMADDEKLEAFNTSFNKIRDITFGMVSNSIIKITTPDGEEVTQPSFISDFLNNSDKGLFKALEAHINEQKKQFDVPPMEVKSTEEQIKAGAPETFEVPITFDQSNFFG